MAKQRKPTWFEVAVHYGGFRSAIKALDFADAWIHAQVALGHDPTVDEVADWWNMSRRTAFRGQAAFRECFPMLETPGAIYANNPKALEGVANMVRFLNKIEASKRSRRDRKDEDVLGLVLEGI